MSGCMNDAYGIYRNRILRTRVQYAGRLLIAVDAENKEFSYIIRTWLWANVTKCLHCKYWTATLKDSTLTPQIHFKKESIIV